MILISPGSGPLNVHNRRHAEENVAAFVEELRLDGVEWSLGELDKFSGRYVFTLRYCGRVLEGLMPGLPGAEVRFYNRPDQDIFSFPRLFLQGSSWCWIWAVQLAREEFVEAAKRGGYSR